MFAFSPRALLPAFVAKAQADGLRGIVIAPFTPSDPVWPALASASLTIIAGQKDRCLILPNSAQFVSEGEDLGGAPATAFASELARRGGSSAHRAGAPAAGWRFRRPETAARRTLERLCRRNGGNKSAAACTRRVSLFRSHGRLAAQARVLVCDL